MPKFLNEIQLPSLSDVIKPKSGMSLYNKSGSLVVLHADGTEHTILVGTADNGVDLSQYYTKEEIDAIISGIEAGDVDLSGYYTKEELDSLLTKYATESFVLNKIAEAQLGGGSGSGSVDLSGYATKDDLDNYATKTSLNNYYKKSEIDNMFSEFEPPVEVDLSNYYTKDQVYTRAETSAIVEEAISEIMAEAPDAYNTFKEIADYITQDQTGAQQMLNTINTNTSNIELKANIKDVYYKTELYSKVELDEMLQNSGGKATFREWAD